MEKNKTIFYQSIIHKSVISVSVPLKMILLKTQKTSWNWYFPERGMEWDDFSCDFYGEDKVRQFTAV